MDCRSFRHHACQPGRLFCLKWVQYRYFSGLIGSAVKVILVFGYDPSFMEKKPPEKSFQTKILKMAVESEQVGIQSEERQVGLRTSSWTLDIFVISQPNWLKFGLQAHSLKMFGHAKFQPSIGNSSICSFTF